MANVRHLAQDLVNQNPYTNRDVQDYYANLSNKDKAALFNEFGDLFNRYGVAPLTGRLGLDYKTNPATIGDIANTIASYKLNQPMNDIDYRRLLQQGYQNPNDLPSYAGMRGLLGY